MNVSKKQVQSWKGKRSAWLMQDAWLRCNFLYANLMSQLFYLGRERQGDALERKSTA